VVRAGRVKKENNMYKKGIHIEELVKKGRPGKNKRSTGCVEKRPLRETSYVTG